ncbi:hypothetical protein GSI_02688 [Ganoderma sinense ZZ0214-1]|uniref:Uncharacterized protein n=1 Tax=Ganoderma sinense ZZ0214-1 TaxID=1077348 RepID=A0A2G8SMB7_9APHY|nr:hypothetical protein GSI_02688 [Ganoderma sinense ZZ0214-1]
MSSRVPKSHAAQTLTGPNDCTAASKFTLCQNLWGASTGVGSQSSTLVSASGNTVSWRTKWQWQNNQNNVKSFANVISNYAKGVQLSALKSAPTAWSWTYESQSSGIRAPTCRKSPPPVPISSLRSCWRVHRHRYDIWTGTAQSGNPATSASSYEIMIWLSGKGGIWPVGSKVQSGISLAGHRWTLWKGPNSNWEVLSFVSEDGDITSFNADLKVFFDYLVKHQGVPSSQYVQTIQAGTEPFTGSASLLTRSYSVALNH